MASSTDRENDASRDFPDCQHQFIRLDRVVVTDTGQLGVIVSIDEPHVWVRLDTGREDSYHVWDLQLIGH